MKRVLLLIVALMPLMLLGSCDIDTDSDAWLNRTVWQADLAGVEVVDYSGEVSKVESGSMRLMFRSVGYNLVYECRLKGYNAAGSVQSLTPVEYGFPTVIVFVEYKDEYDVEHLLRNIGTVSDDLKTLHFDSFQTSPTSLVFTNLDLKR